LPKNGEELEKNLKNNEVYKMVVLTRKGNDRKIVISPKTAHLLSRLVQDKGLLNPDPMKDENILVYYKRKKTGSFQEKDYYVWEGEFMEKMVNHKFVHEHQSEIFMNLDFYQFGTHRHKVKFRRSFHS